MKKKFFKFIKYALPLIITIYLLVAFIPRTYEKVRELSEMIYRRNAKTLIEVDGGVSLSNAGKLIEVGANVLVAGNTVFSSENPTETIHLLKTVTSHNIEVR